MEGAKTLAEWILEEGPFVVLSGAGMSTESNLPDFRSAQGLWARFDPARLATEWAMENRPDEFYAFYRMRVEALTTASPNIGHRILAEWEKLGRLSAIVTQNVDGLHQAAGSRRVVELHGSLRSVRCRACGERAPSARLLEGPFCPACGGRLRPDVVLFGESLPGAALEEAEHLASTAGLFVVLGSSLAVSPANSLPGIAAACGAKVAIVNREATPFDGRANLVIHGGIGEVLSETRRILSEMGRS
jgi:NAD-dependent deacetylase